MFSKIQNLTPFNLFQIFKQGILFFENKKIGMLTYKKIEFKYLNWMDPHENLHAISQLHVLDESMLHFESGPSSMTIWESKRERVIK